MRLLRWPSEYLREDVGEVGLRIDSIEFAAFDQRCDDGRSDRHRGYRLKRQTCSNSPIDAFVDLRNLRIAATGPRH